MTGEVWVQEWVRVGMSKSMGWGQGVWDGVCERREGEQRGWDQGGRGGEGGELNKFCVIKIKQKTKKQKTRTREGKQGVRWSLYILLL